MVRARCTVLGSWGRDQGTAGHEDRPVPCKSLLPLCCEKSGTGCVTEGHEEVGAAYPRRLGSGKGTWHSLLICLLCGNCPGHRGKSHLSRSWRSRGQICFKIGRSSLAALKRRQGRQTNILRRVQGQGRIWLCSDLSMESMSCGP